MLNLEDLWFEKRPSLFTKLLLAGLTPLETAYKAGLHIGARRQKPLRVDCPVVSIGNLTVGGNGKTPLVMELARILDGEGKRVAIISRGYGRKSKGTRVVHVPGSSSSDFRAAGDEPSLMSRRCPYACVVVGEDRVDAARLAVETWKPDVILCDDAFQHRRLYRDLDVLAVHAHRGFGNRRLLPAGPMREPMAAASRAQLLVFSYATDEDPADLRAEHGIDDSMPAVCCSMDVSGLVNRDFEITTDPMPGRVIAVSAIANPSGFLASLKSLGVDVVGDIRWRDHHRASSSEWKKVAALVDSTGADAVVLTEKDLVCLGDMDAGVDVFGLRIDVEWRDGADLNLVRDMLLAL